MSLVIATKIQCDNCNLTFDVGEGRKPLRRQALSLARIKGWYRNGPVLRCSRCQHAHRIAKFREASLLA